MQVLAAPTRQEVDVAHGRNYWLRVGIQDLKCFKYAPKGRLALWLILLLSSLPLHLMYVWSILQPGRVMI